MPSSLHAAIDKVPKSVVNFVVEPSASYFDPLSHTHDDVDLELGLESMYRLESLGIDEESDQGSIDVVYTKKFLESICFKEGHYHVQLPWYEDILQSVPSNHHVALAALRTVKKRLDTQGLSTEYGKIFQQYEEEGIIERIQVEYRDLHKYIWIPHRPVIKTQEQVTTKIRPVFNCSLKVGDSPSLNQAAYPGVDLLASLFKLLLQFRTNKYVVIADIAKAFLQIRLKLEEDRNRFCFFWEEAGELRMFRYTSIIFGLAVSPYILGAVIQHHVRQYPSDLVSSLLLNNMYMDNFIHSSSSIESLQEVFHTATSRMKEGGFDLCSWNSNSPELRDVFSGEDKASKLQCSEEKVLGYLFDVSSDSLRLSDFELGDVTSKRQLLSEIAKVFDPLSLFLPVTIRGRILMKKTWEQGIGWDDEIDPEIKNSWEKLRLDLDSMKEVTFPRSCFESGDSDLTVNVFCDASTTCYGFVVYISSPSKAPSLLWAKGKVAPAKGKTLPCLELLAVFLALLCLPKALESFPGAKFKTLNIFSDSQITLAWIKNGAKNNKSIFVRNRLQDIKGMTSSLKQVFSLSPNFYFVRSEENPSDLLTRGISLTEFRKKFDFWFKGPEWLPLDPIYWPRSDGETVNVGISSSVFITMEKPKDPPVVNFSKYSNLGTVIRVCSNLFKFAALTRDCSVDCDFKARVYCLKVMQQESFSEELEFLGKIKEDPSSQISPPDLVKNLNLFLDDNGLIRSKGRLSRSNFYDFDVLNPIVLGKNHHLTRLIIKDSHFECKHLGLQATLTRLRLKGYWITSARTTIKRVLSDCIICKKFNSFSFQYPRFTNFTRAQVELFRPFKHVGVDFTKHWWVKVGESSRAQKMFIAVYTCLNIRAVYLDLIPDMSSASFVQSFQRFVSRFGVPDFLYSDNARGFVQGAKAVETFVVSENGREFLRKNQIQHRRIPLYSPWMGSLWERLIRIVKDCLYKTIGRSSIEFYNFITILSDISDAINSRPLTYTSSENDVIPLTPNCFLKPHAKTSMALPGTGPDDPLWESPTSSRDTLLKSLQKVSEKFEELRTRWYEEYLLSLRELSRDLYETKWDNLVKPNDVVLIRSPVKDRPYWQMGIITKLIHGDDGKVRSVYVRTSGGQIDHYPLKHLYPLELSLTHSGNRPTNAVPPDSSENSAVVPSAPVPFPASAVPKSRSTRPQRRAAIRAQNRFVQSDSEESD